MCLSPGDPQGPAQCLARERRSKQLVQEGAPLQPRLEAWASDAESVSVTAGAFAR